VNTRIINLSGELYVGEAKLVNVQTQSGEITILPGHLPIISVLKNNSRLYLADQSGMKEFKVAGGFLHLDTQNNLNILVD